MNECTVLLVAAALPVGVVFVWICLNLAKAGETQFLLSPPASRRVLAPKKR